MEDAHIANDNIDGQHTGLFAIFDGHGGVEVAKYCERHFTDVLVNSELFKAKNYAKALEETFMKLDVMIAQSFNELHQISAEFPA